jgi:hypothetical protein
MSEENNTKELKTQAIEYFNCDGFSLYHFRYVF